MSVPKGFRDCGERFASPFEASVAAHDYAHEGYYFRVVRFNETTWGVFVKWGRELKPACCEHKRTYVNEEPKQLWEPRSDPELRKRTNHTRSA